MNKNLYFKICSFIIGGFLIIWSASFTLFLLKERNEKNQDISDIPEHVAENVQSTVESARIKHFVARSSGDKIVIYEVYTNGFEKPVIMPDIDIKQLPPQDKESFEQGIILEDRAALASLIEDFTS